MTELAIKDNYIHHLTDDILREILCRLPSCEMAVQCKCVCQRWLELISHPDFSGRFVAFKMKKSSLVVDPGSKRRKLNSRSVSKQEEEEQPPFAFILRSDKLEKALALTEDAAFESDGFSLSFLPGSEAIGMSVLPSSSDLLFCWRSKVPRSEVISASFSPSPSSSYRIYLSFWDPCRMGSALYICNPRTKQWIQLPEPPRFEPTEMLEPFVRHGFITDPYYSFDGRRGSVTLDPSFRFLVFTVAIPESFTRLALRMFSSTTGQWQKCVLVCEKLLRMNFHLEHVPAVAYNGMLHFLCRNGIVAFDPYEISHEGVVRSRVIHLRGGDLAPLSSAVLGVCRGNLRMVQCGRNTSDPNSVLQMEIWDLVDYPNGRWHLVRVFSFAQLTSLDNFTILKLGLLKAAVTPGIHPYDGDIVVLKYLDHVVLCDTRTKKLGRVIEIPDRCNMYSVVLPWWPTPLPQRLV